ncbi:hypothetical protein [Streptomyces sp. TE5632]
MQRKRSQIAVVDHDGAVRVNRNVPSGVTTVLSVVGDPPIGAPAAFEAACGWGRLVQLPEDHGFEPHPVPPLRCKAIASARLKNDRADAAALARLLRADLCRRTRACGAGKIFVAGDHPAAAVAPPAQWAAYECPLVNLPRSYRSWLTCWWSRRMFPVLSS